MTSTTPGNGNNNDKQISMLFCGAGKSLHQQLSTWPKLDHQAQWYGKARRS